MSIGNEAKIYLLANYLHKEVGEMMHTEWKLTEFGEKVEKMRSDIGMTKTELAKRTGITTTYYDFIIHGQRTGYCQRDKILAILSNPIKEAS